MKWEEYKKMMAIYGVKFTTKDEMNEFYDDGIQILDFLRKNRAKVFFNKDYEISWC